MTNLQFQTLIDLTFAFRRVVQALEKISARYVVVGSTAASAWGVARSTRDIDVVAVITHETVDSFLSALGNNEIYVPVDEARVAAESGGSFNVVLSKLLWRVQTRSEVQWRDCVEVAATQNLDVKYLRIWATQLGISEDVEELLEATRR